MEYKPHKKQREVHSSPKRFKLLVWGRQSGKSILTLNYNYYEALRCQGRYWIVLPTYKQAKSVYWKQYIQMIPKELIEKKDAQDLSVIFKSNLEINLPDGTKVKHDPSKPPSMIELKGSDDADTLRGAKVNGLTFDEYAFHRPDTWDSVFRPMLLTTGGWAMFVSSPNGYNHFYDMAMSAKSDKSWMFSHATPYDNPFVPDSELDEIRKTVSGLKWQQEYMAEFVQREGLVYPDFKQDIHVLEPEEIPTEGTRVIAIDFGWTNPTAVLFILIDYDQNWYIYDEIYRTRLHTDDLFNIIKDKIAGKTITHYVGDSAQAENIADLQRKGLPIVGIKKRGDYIPKGIELISEGLKPRIQLSGKPRPKLFVSSGCKNAIFEFGNYHYKEIKDNRQPNEKPVKEFDHTMDALRYAKLYLAYEVNQKIEIPKFDKLSTDGFFV